MHTKTRKLGEHGDLMNFVQKEPLLTRSSYTLLQSAQADVPRMMMLL